jgi:multidrug efflux pump subunit AcrA (membrane-fusion protein)
MNKQVSGNFGIIPLLIFLSACSHKTESTKPKAAPPTIVDVLVATAKPISNTLEVNGTVVANEYVELHPEASGRLTYLYVPEGKLIKKGTLIARVYNADLQAQVEKSKVALDLAKKTEERDRKLLEVNGINQADYDAALNIVNGFKADIDYNQALLDKTILKAPFDGYIGLRQVSEGAYVTPSTLIATLLNYLTPTGVAGVNGTAIGTPLGTTAMKLRLNTTLSTGAAFGTEIANGTGYAAGGFTSLGQSTSTGTPIVVGVPLTTQSATATSAWSIASFDLTGNGAQRGFWGPFNAQPIVVGIGNTFQITGGAAAAAGIQISLT